MKIAILADPLDNQGAGVHVFTKELINALVQIGKADQLILFREKVDPNLPVQQIAVPNIHLPIGFASLRLFILIPWLLRKYKVDVVFEPAHFGPFNLPNAIKRMTMIHDLTPLLFPHYHRWHSQLLQRLFLPSILRNTHWVVTNSKHTQSDVERTFPFTRDKISHLYLGKNDIYKPTLDPQRIQDMGIDDPYFLYVGTIEPRKNVVVLLAAFTTLCQQNNDNATHLVIAGQLGWKSEAFQHALAQHPFRHRIHVLGYVALEDLPILYTHAIALVYPSEYEGFGLPIVEAMACGTPVITARNSSLKEIGEGAATFFATADATDLALKMQDTKLRPIGKDALMQHAAQFSWSACAHSFWQTAEALRGGK